MVLKCGIILHALHEIFCKLRVTITLTENKKCAKYDSARLIILDCTFLYADNGSMSEYTRLRNTTTMKVLHGTRVLHLSSLVE